MHSIFAALSARTGSISRLLASLALVAAALLPAGCANHQESPRDLWAHLQQLNGEGKARELGKLYTDDDRDRQGKAWDSYKEFLRINPEDLNQRKVVENWGVTAQEFARLTHIEIFELEMEKNKTRSAMVGARITDDEPATDLENAHRVYWVTAAGQKCVMLTQFVDGKWWLVTLKE